MSHKSSQHIFTRMTMNVYSDRRFYNMWHFSTSMNKRQMGPGSGLGTKKIKAKQKPLTFLVNKRMNTDCKGWVEAPAGTTLVFLETIVQRGTDRKKQIKNRVEPRCRSIHFLPSGEVFVTVQRRVLPSCTFKVTRTFNVYLRIIHYIVSSHCQTF